MAQNGDASPVYYREIQKNAYLKRIPEENNKLLPLGLKKQPLKPLWTQLCIHNGRAPYLEQYKDPVSARAHRPVWRHCLTTARHVTASVTARESEYDFLIDTDSGPVRMLAPDWESMQDWVHTLRSALQELRVFRACENVYVPPPSAPAPRAPARDPMSPLPPVPTVPPDRVPGIDLTSVTRQPQPEATEPHQPQSQPCQPQLQTNQPQLQTSQPQLQTSQPQSQPHQPQSQTSQPQLQTSQPQLEPQNIDISNWDSPSTSVPSTSQLPSKGVTKICGQNICLDDSIFKRDFASDDDDDIDTSDSEYKQTVLVSDGKQGDGGDDTRPSNVTVIQVSNKDPPHTAIPVIHPETQIFNFDIKPQSFVNIVHTENVQNSNEYGTVFENSDYGHLSLTTTVNLTGDVKVTDVNVRCEEGLYERLCLASTDVSSPLSVRRIKNQDKLRKSSLPNLDINTGNSTYEYLFLSQNNNVASNAFSSNSNLIPVCNNSNTSISDSNNVSTVSTNTTSISTDSPSFSTISTNQATISTNSMSNSTNLTSNSTNLTSNSTNLTANSTNLTSNSTNLTSNSTNSQNSTSNVTLNGTDTNSNVNTRVHINSVSVNNVNSNTRGIRANIERSLSQNACDVPPRRDRKENCPVKGKSEKSSPKPIWKRGLTELSLLSKLKGIGPKRSDSPSRNGHGERNGVTSPAKVVHKSRPEGRLAHRRRSSSLSNGEPQQTTSALIPLRSRQAMLLREEQRRGAALVATLSRNDPPLVFDYNNMVWFARWGNSGSRVGGRAGDRAVGGGGAALTRASDLRAALTHASHVDILFHRVPLAKIYVATKRDKEPLGIKLDNECNIVGVEPESPAARAGLPPPGKWAVTEVNNRPINLIKGGEEDMIRLSVRGTEASILIQPSSFVKHIRTTLKANRNLLGLR